MINLNKSKFEIKGENVKRMARPLYQLGNISNKNLIMKNHKCYKIL